MVAFGFVIAVGFVVRFGGRVSLFECGPLVGILFAAQARDELSRFRSGRVAEKLDSPFAGHRPYSGDH
jgi:hypothetical protein